MVSLMNERYRLTWLVAADNVRRRRMSVSNVEIPNKKANQRYMDDSRLSTAHAVPIPIVRNIDILTVRRQLGSTACVWVKLQDGRRGGVHGRRQDQSRQHDGESPGDYARAGISIISIIIIIIVVVVITGSALEQHCADGHISSHWEGRILTHTDYSTESKP